MRVANESKCVRVLCFDRLFAARESVCVCVTVDRFDELFAIEPRLLRVRVFVSVFMCFLYSARWCETIIWLSRVCVFAFARKCTP